MDMVDWFLFYKILLEDQRVLAVCIIVWHIILVTLLVF